MPHRYSQDHMVVKTDTGYVKVRKERPPGTKRALLNLEKGHLEALLDMFEEISHVRAFFSDEKYIEILLKEALDRAENGW